MVLIESKPVSPESQLSGSTSTFITGYTDSLKIRRPQIVQLLLRNSLIRTFKFFGN